MSYPFEITDTIQPQDREEIRQGLLAYNMARLENKNVADLGVYLRDETGKVTAGLTGTTHGNWFCVQFLWVSEPLRGQHIGSRLLALAEETAKHRGCRYAFLDTFEFQAPGFYEKQGYRPACTLPHYPVTGTRYYLTKKL